MYPRSLLTMFMYLLPSTSLDNLSDLWVMTDGGGSILYAKIKIVFVKFHDEDLRTTW